jgi:hypothetical protein
MAKKFVISYSNSIKPKKTKHLSSEAIDLKFDYEGEYMVASGSDQANTAKISKAFVKEMTKLVNNQVGYLNDWLKEKSQVIEDLIKEIKDAQKTLDSEDISKKDAQAFQKSLKFVEVNFKKVVDLQNDYQTIIEDWGTNCANQQGLIAFMLAKKAARIETYEDKSFRITNINRLKGVLIIAGAFVAVSAFVLAAPALAPAMLALAIAGATISTVCNMSALNKLWKENGKLEQRLLSKVEADIKNLESVLSEANKTQGSIGKHLTELGNMMMMRKDSITKTEDELLRLNHAIKTLKTDAASLKKEESQGLKVKGMAKKLKNAEKLDVERIKVKAELAQFKSGLKEGLALEARLNKINVTLDDVCGIKPNTISSNVEKLLTTTDGWQKIAGHIGVMSGVAKNF